MEDKACITAQLSKICVHSVEPTVKDEVDTLFKKKKPHKIQILLRKAQSVSTRILVFLEAQVFFCSYSNIIRQ